MAKKKKRSDSRATSLGITVGRSSSPSAAPGSSSRRHRERAHLRRVDHTHEEVLARLTAHLTIKQLQQQLQAKNDYLQAEISARKQAQAEQTQLIAELDAFAYTVAHDLKNPLATIVASTDVLLDDWPPAQTQNW